MSVNESGNTPSAANAATGEKDCAICKIMQEGKCKDLFEVKLRVSVSAANLSTHLFLG